MKLAFVTGTRAEYGLLRPLLLKAFADPELECRLLVTGAHLRPEYGNTVSEIEKDGLPIAERTDILRYGNTRDGVVQASGLALRLFGAWFAIVAFIVGYCVYNLFILKMLVRKEIVYLTDGKLKKISFKNKLLKKCCIVFVIIFSGVMVGLISVSIADENGVFVEKVTFTDPDEFIEYVQTQYDEWY